VIEIRQTDTFADWFEGLRDRQARARITGAFVACRSAIRAT
jgi:putative component of toxin-antitoxin plasmid stabilization module